MTEEVIIRTSLILLAAWIGSRLMSRATAATRHMLWHWAIAAVLAAPLLIWILPKYDLPLSKPPSLALFTKASFPPSLALSSKASDGGKLASVNTASEGGLPGMQAVWLLGVCLTGLWFLTTHVMAAVLCRRARPASARIEREAETLAAELGIARRVALLVSSNGGPFTVGVFRPRIVLPQKAESWDTERLRTVFLHELAHVRRGDCRVQGLASVACAVYWFNPLVWIAARALRSERERACDDEVLLHGAQASAYATHLLEIARGQQTRMVSPALLAMARPRELEGRLLAILAAGRARVPARRARGIVAAAVAVTTIATLGARPMGQSAKAEVPPAAAREPDRERATIALALDQRPDVIPALITALSDVDADVREKAALGLGWRADARVVEPLIAALRDRSPQVREKAALALGSSGDARALAPLEAALKDPDAQVREKAVIGLVQLGAGRDPDADGAAARDALGVIVNGLLKLTR